MCLCETLQPCANGVDSDRIGNDDDDNNNNHDIGILNELASPNAFQITNGNLKFFVTTMWTRRPPPPPSPPPLPTATMTTDRVMAYLLFDNLHMHCSFCLCINCNRCCVALALHRTSNHTILSISFCIVFALCCGYFPFLFARWLDVWWFQVTDDSDWTHCNCRMVSLE